MVYFCLNHRNNFSLRCAVSVRTATVVMDRIKHLGLFLFKGTRLCFV